MDVLQKKSRVAQIVSQYRQSQGLSLRAFAEALMNDISGDPVSYASISNWEHGKFTPNYYFLIHLITKTGDWRYDFAVDLLSVLKPDLYEPMTAIGRGEPVDQ